jgi:molybdenum cofactor guanylyltransferase
MSLRGTGPVGVLLAGGKGRHLGGEKAGVSLAGRPLAHWALDGLTAALPEVVVACRLDTELPPLPGVVEAWVEPEGRRGPLAGIVSALHEARGRPVVVVALSLPLVDVEVVEVIATADARGRPAVMASVGGRLEPLVARYEPGALPVLAGLRPTTALEAAAAALEPATVYFDADDDRFLQVKRPEDLLRAAAFLDGRQRAPAL